jgi:hypothetical protein
MLIHKSRRYVSRREALLDVLAAVALVGMFSALVGMFVYAVDRSIAERQWQSQCWAQEYLDGVELDCRDDEIEDALRR